MITDTASTSLSESENADSSQLVEEMKESIRRQLRLTLARHLDNATPRELWMATCLAVREKIIDRFIETQSAHNERDARRVYYLSLSTSWEGFLIRIFAIPV